MLKRDIFRTGEYVNHFNPDDKRNPFSRIYTQKKRDAINIISRSKQPRIVLDIGGGMGRLSLALLRIPQTTVVLSDISLDMLKLVPFSENSSSKVTLINADGHHLPFSDDLFDFVVGLDLLCHLENPETALREFHRVLKDNGILMLDSTNSNPLWAVFYPRYLGKNPLNWLKILKFHGVYPGWEMIVQHYPKKQFFSLLNRFGFQIRQILTYGPKICPKWHLAIAIKV